MTPVVDLQFLGLIIGDIHVPHYVPLMSYLPFSRPVSHIFQVLAVAGSSPCAELGCCYTGEKETQTF